MYILLIYLLELSLYTYKNIVPPSFLLNKKQRPLLLCEKKNIPVFTIQQKTGASALLWHAPKE
jgi:hypothetical protein